MFILKGGWVASTGQCCIRQITRLAREPLAEDSSDEPPSESSEIGPQPRGVEVGPSACHGGTYVTTVAQRTPTIEVSSDGSVLQD